MGLGKQSWHVLVLVPLTIVVLAALLTYRRGSAPTLQGRSNPKAPVVEPVLDLVHLGTDSARVTALAQDSEAALPDLTPETPELEETAADTGRVLVHVEDHLGIGIPSVVVTISTPGRGGSHKNDQTAKTDPFGDLVIDEFPAGNVSVMLRSHTIPEGHWAPHRLELQGTLDAEGLCEIIAVCPKAGRISGEVLKAYHVPVSFVRLHLSIESRFFSNQALVTADEEGRFESRDLRPGMWWVRTYLFDGFRYLSGAAPAGQWVQVVAGETSHVKLVPPDTGSHFRGRVVDQNGGPVQGLLVAAYALRPDDSSLNPRSHGRGVAYDVTDASGDYIVGPIQPDDFVDGKMVIQVAARQGSRRVTSDAVLLKESPEPFLAEIGDTVTSTVERESSFIQWRVRLRCDSEFGDPGRSPREFVYKVGHCTLVPDEYDVLTFLTHASLRKTALQISRAGNSWKRTLRAGEGAFIELELTVPSG